MFCKATENTDICRNSDRQRSERSYHDALKTRATHDSIGRFHGLVNSLVSTFFCVVHISQINPVLRSSLQIQIYLLLVYKHKHNCARDLCCFNITIRSVNAQTCVNQGRCVHFVEMFCPKPAVCNEKWYRMAKYLNK